MFLWNLLSEFFDIEFTEKSPIVLILVFVEFTLRGWTDGLSSPQCWVLILVFVEFTLRGSIKKGDGSKASVLILVFVEFTLRGTMTANYRQSIEVVLILVFVEFTLRGKQSTQLNLTEAGLNPCFCGIYSQSRKGSKTIYIAIVLILVFVEFTLRERFL